MAFYKQDIVDINLNTGNIYRSFLNHAIGYKNDDADRFGIRTFRDGEPVDLTGVSCQAVFMAPDGSNIALTSYGTVIGNVAYVTLPPACYNYEGQFCLSIQLVGGGVTGTMRIVDGMVVNTGASGTVAPTSAVPTYQEIIAQYNAMVEATAVANGAIAATYSQKAYAVGEYCIHDGGLYRCTTAITTAEAWNSAHWTAAKIGPDVSDLKSALISSVQIDNDELSIDSSMFVSGSYENTDNTLNPIDNNKRIRTTNFVLIRGVTKVEWNCTSGYSARIYSLDENYNVLSTHGYDPSGSFGVESNGWYLAILLMHGSSTIQPSEASNLSVSFSYSSTNIMKFRKVLGSGEITNVSDLLDFGNGWYGFGGNVGRAINGKPTNYTDIAGYFEVKKPNYNGNFTEIVLCDVNGNEWSIVYNTANKAVYRDWEFRFGPLTNNILPLYGKKVAIIGDSISTNGDLTAQNPYGNVPEIIVQSEDVGVALSAFATYYDVGVTIEGTVTIDGVTTTGHTIASADIGKEITFTPTINDVGVIIGKPLSYNQSSTIVWWEIAMNALGFTPIPVCWSGSSITSHEARKSSLKTSYAWHDAQIRKCGIRTPGTMTRTAPDVIIIYRGTNDMTHTSIPQTDNVFTADVELTGDYFDDYDWEYPDTDFIRENPNSDEIFGFKQGMCMTIKKLRNAYPNAKIFLCTLNVFKRVNYSHFPTNNGVNSLPQYNDAIREVADFMGCGVIDFDKDGITFENCYSQGYITDSSTTPTHPSNKGHKVMGLKAIADLKAQYSSME